jgi:short-subunit dehydrogenase
MASPSEVSKVIVSGLASGKRVVYAPKRWRLIMAVVRSIPFFIFKKLTF